MIKDKLKLLPTNPGVYVMLNKDEQVIYVGKAKNLKNRVRQYFVNGVKTDKVMAMVNNVADFYYIITPSEIDALSLENNLIKKHKPRYNVLLKDDKTYPYLKISLKDKYPFFTVTRKIKKDGAKYFGPFMGGVSIASVLEIISLAFNLRLCTQKLGDKIGKPCLNYHISKCLAPCANKISEDEYMKLVKKAIDFLSGDTKEVERLLKEKMLLASEREEFELALKYRENLQSLEKIKLKRITSLNKFINADVIAYTDNGIYSAVNLLIVRSGRMLGSKNFAFESVLDGKSSQIEEFITGYYKENSDIPDEIIVGQELENHALISQYFASRLGKKIAVNNALIGARRQLFEMAEVNALEYLDKNTTKIKHKNDMTVNACAHLQQILSLKRYPKRIECYDISNISGVDKVGSMTVFIDGQPAKEFYRRFKIKTVDGADDFKSLQEVLSRRLEKLNTDIEKFPKPDLIVIDGGKGQLSSVNEIFTKFNITDIDLISLAEREEEIFQVDNPKPILLSKSDYALKVLIRIRDEAHRFAITFHRSLRGKRTLTSLLDGVLGLGKVKKRKLLEKFKDLGGIISAKKEELMQVDGIGENLAQNIIDKLQEEGLL